MAHAVDQQQLRAGNGRCRVFSSFHPHQRIDGAMNDQRRRPDRPQPILAIARGENGAQLPSDARRIEAARICCLGAVKVFCFVLRE